jgi:hypothetical protein
MLYWPTYSCGSVSFRLSGGLKECESSSTLWLTSSSVEGTEVLLVPRTSPGTLTIDEGTRGEQVVVERQLLRAWIHRRISAPRFRGLHDPRIGLEKPRTYSSGRLLPGLADLASLRRLHTTKW